MLYVPPSSIPVHVALITLFVDKKKVSSGFLIYSGDEPVSGGAVVSGTCVFVVSGNSVVVSGNSVVASVLTGAVVCPEVSSVLTVPHETSAEAESSVASDNNIASILFKISLTFRNSIS